MLVVGSYAVDAEHAVRWASGLGLRSLLVEAPDGLKHVAVALARALRDAGFHVVVSGRHAWGGCDVGVSEAAALGLEGVIHLGHHGPVGFTSTSLPVLFLPVLSAVDPLPHFRRAVLEALSSGYSRIAIGVTAQHAHLVDALEREARGLGAEPIVGGLGGARGLVTGCNYSSLERGDASVVVAGGVFHALGAALWTGKPVWSVDPFLGIARKVDAKAAVARRLEALSRAIESKSFAVVVSTKVGQRRLHLARRIVEALLSRGREAWIVALDDVAREALVDLGGAEAYVNTACPRLAVDDAELFPGPVINPGEVKYVLRGTLEGYSPRDVFLFDPRDLDGA